MAERAAWLKDDRFIRIAGALLIVSPIFNFITSFAISHQSADKWTQKQIIAGLLLSTNSEWFARIANMIVGTLMFRRITSAWIPVLAVLGFSIARNILSFQHNYKVNQFFTISSLAINVLLFALVFESEYNLNKELKAKLAAAQLKRAKMNTPVTPPPTKKDTDLKPSTNLISGNFTKENSSKNETILPLNHKAEVTAIPTRKKIKVRVEIEVTKGSPIEFEGIGKFAEVVRCSKKELWILPLKTVPKDIEKKVINLEIPGQLGFVKLKYSRRESENLIFKIS